jgi:SpoVK/Ycf46/Vps4 family AAA+-type ATPase
LRLDVGAVFEAHLGESEANMRQAIRLAETVSPCILWVDELEKAFAGADPRSINAGAPTRVLGTFLTWLQEREKPIFVIATANDVGALPPELLARFERTFFLDLPNAGERRAIFTIHLKRAGVQFPETQRWLRMDELVEESQGFVGREIERVVREAQFTAFADDNRQITMDDLRQAMKETVPVARSHAEVVENLRRWKTEGRAFPASSEEEAPDGRAGRQIQPS